MGHDTLVDQDRRIPHRKDHNDREHDRDDGGEHKGNKREKVRDEQGFGWFFRQEKISLL